MTDKSLRFDEFQKKLQSDQKEEEEMKTPEESVQKNLTLVYVLIEPASK